MSAAAGWIAAELALKSTALLAAAFIAARALAKRSAAERHLIWCAAVVGLLVLPVAHSLSPSPLIVPLERLVRAFPPADATKLSLEQLAASPQAHRSGESAASGVATSAEFLQQAPHLLDARHDAPAQSPSWLGVGSFALFHLGVAALLLARLLGGIVRVELAVRGLQPLADAPTQTLLDAERRRAGLRRRIRLLGSPSETTPWVWGMRRPAIVVPSDFARWPTDARRNVLRHELAHVARCDHVTGLLSRLCVALYWSHPLMWLAHRRLALAAEQACDDRVVVAGALRTDYAAQLLAVASSVRRRGEPVLGVAPTKSQDVVQRIRSILDADTRRTTMSKTKAGLIALAAAAAFAPLALVRSQSPLPATAPVADLGDPALVFLARRAPVNSDELGRAVRAHLAYDLDARATELIAEYIVERDAPIDGEEVLVEPALECAYCEAMLASLVHAAGPDGQVDALLAAIEMLEERAHAELDGDLLLRLAFAVGNDAWSDTGLQLHYLVEALAIGNLEDSAKLAAADMLGRRGWYEPARSIVAKMHDDPASIHYQSSTTQSWLNYFDGQMDRQSHLAARLSPARAAESDMDYLPTYKVSPYYPAAAQGIGGSVIVEFTVTERGRTRDVSVISSTDSVFEEAAIWAARQFRYMPRMIGEVPTEVEGVRNRITFTQH
jgi:TonB family protein